MHASELQICLLYSWYNLVMRKQILEHMHLNLPRTDNIIQKVANSIVALFRSIQRAEKLVKYDIEQFPQ